MMCPLWFIMNMYWALNYCAECIDANETVYGVLTFRANPNSGILRQLIPRNNLLLAIM